MFTSQPQIQQQAPRSGEIQKLKQQQSEEVYAIDNSGDKQETIKTNRNSEQQYPSSPKSSPRQVLPQTFSESLEDSNEEIEREFRSLTVDKQKEYKELIAETYLLMVNSRIEKTLFYIWDDTKRDTKTFIDSVFSALENPVEKPRNFELKFNPQYSLEGNLYELNRIYNKDRDVLDAKYILSKEEFDFKSKILLEQIPKYTLKAVKEYFNDDDFKEYSSLVSDKIERLENSNQGRVLE